MFVQLIEKVLFTYSSMPPYCTMYKKQLLNIFNQSPYVNLRLIIAFDTSLIVMIY